MIGLSIKGNRNTVVAEVSQKINKSINHLADLIRDAIAEDIQPKFIGIGD